MSFPVITRAVNRGNILSCVARHPALNTERSLSRKLDADTLGEAKPFESIPKVPTLPVIGSTWAYLPYIGKYNVEKMHVADIHKHETYGYMVREKFGKLELVNCYHPDAMLAIMNEDDECPSRGDFATLKAYRNKRRDWYQPGGLLVSEGKEWKNLRDAIKDYTCKPEFIEYYFDPINKIAEDFVELIRNSRNNKEEVANAVSHLNKWSLEAISFLTLDKRLGCLVPSLYSSSDAMEMIKAIEVQIECMNQLEASAGNIQYWKYFPTPTWQKFVKAADTFTSLAFNFFTRSAFEAKQAKGESRQSLLQHLARHEKAGVSSAMVLMTDLMMAGIDTTSYTAAFLLYDLANNPKKQEQAMKEIRNLLPAQEKLTLEKYKELKYLRYCLKESMRLHPVARGNIRIFKNDAVVCGYKIPAGTAVICVLQVVYKSPKYFYSPEQFEPERWIHDAYPFFQPFGYGARNCIGSSLAELEILTLATEVLRNFTLGYHHEDIGMTTKLINTPDKPMRLRFQEH